MILSTASLRPPLVSDDPATLSTDSSSSFLPTTASAMPLAKRPWYSVVVGLSGMGSTSTPETTSASRVRVTPTSSGPAGDW
ncbi:hypothetical protein AC792_10025 [Arthrobacter sp. RIT-PI-e]|nr:hypothetical protein AC792_10025 [Arthrobacter sp. RIT-PI-e]